jgi:hypothetical protein
MERNGRRKMRISCRAERQGSHETFARGQRRVSFVYRNSILVISRCLNPGERWNIASVSGDNMRGV